MGEKSGDAEEEEHEEHTGVLEVVHVSGIEDATVYEDLKVGCVKKLDAEVKKGPAHDQVELKVDEAAVKEPIRDGVPRSSSEGLWTGDEPGERAPHVPKPGREEQSSGERVTSK